jgi:glutamine amidotransferase
MGNLPSVVKALEAAGARARVSPQVDHAADALCVPGQGVFGNCMTALGQDGLGVKVGGWIDGGRPYLGICLGMQILFEHSEEGDVPGLGVLPGSVTRLPGPVRVPHIGWNTVSSEGGDTYFYFDHSFAVRPDDAAIVKGWCEHGERFAAWIERDGLTAVQFHPEKSSRDGIALLAAWVKGL